jgi:hypothetical protein
MTIYHFSDTPVLYEHAWLEDLFHTRITYQPYSPHLPPHAWVLLQRPHVSTAYEAIKTLHSVRLLHLSDEFEQDDLAIYDLPTVHTIVRTYPRSNTQEKVITIPLGWHHSPMRSTGTGVTAAVPYSARPLLWSFHGTDWMDRSHALEAFRLHTPHDLRLQPQWEHPTRSTPAEYLDALQRSRFAPILRGHHYETFRFYEALEAKTLPVTTMTENVFINTIEKELALSELYPWRSPTAFELTPEEGDRIQQEVTKRWEAWKARVRATLTQRFTS